MRIISLFILILYGNIYAYSQQVYRGTVNDSQTGKGIEDAVVSLLNEQMLIIDFTYTDKKGISLFPLIQFPTASCCHI